MARTAEDLAESLDDEKRKTQRNVDDKPRGTDGKSSELERKIGSREAEGCRGNQEDIAKYKETPAREVRGLQHLHWGASVGGPG